VSLCHCHYHTDSHTHRHIPGTRTP
jgi:hypothetical protein